MPRSSMAASRSGPSTSVGGATRGALMPGTRRDTSGKTQCACTSMIDTGLPPTVTRFGAACDVGADRTERTECEDRTAGSP